MALWDYMELLIFSHSNILHVSHLFTSLYCWVSEVVSSFLSSSCKETVFIKKLLSLSKQTIELCPPLLVWWTLCALCLYLVIWEQNLKVQLSSGGKKPPLRCLRVSVVWGFPSWLTGSCLSDTTYSAIRRDVCPWPSKARLGQSCCPVELFRKVVVKGFFFEGGQSAGHIISLITCSPSWFCFSSPPSSPKSSLSPLLCAWQHLNI